MSDPAKPRVLCVNEDRQMLASLTFHLGDDYDVYTAPSGCEALGLLRDVRNIAVVVIDLHMRETDGATLLQSVREVCPDATRVALTSQSDIECAGRAVNEGRVFHLLTRPCAPGQLRAAVAVAVQQHRLRRAEQRLLRDTLSGCVGALAHALAMTNPIASGRAGRVKQLVMELAEQLGYRNFWQLEAAALLSQLGHIATAPEVVRKLYSGARLSAQEQALAAEAPHVAAKLLDYIPNLEPVLRILTALTWSDEQLTRVGDSMIAVAARILGVSVEYEALTSRGYTPAVAVHSLRDRSARFGDELIAKLARHVGVNLEPTRVCELPLRHVRPGMTILDNIRADRGPVTLLVPRGSKVTGTLLERIRTFAPKAPTTSIRVLAPCDP